MAKQVSYSKARANFSKLLDQASLDQELVVIERKNKEPVAMISLSELEGLSETAHLLRSPKNRKRLLGTLERSSSTRSKAMSLEELAKNVGLT